DLQVPAQVAVGQQAQFLQVVEQQALWVRDQRGHDPQTGLLVDDAFQAVVGEAAGRINRFGFVVRHRVVRGSSRGPRPRRTGQWRTARPSPTGTGRLRERTGASCPRSGKTGPPRVSAWAVSCTTRKSQVKNEWSKT